MAFVKVRLGFGCTLKKDFESHMFDSIGLQYIGQLFKKDVCLIPRALGGIGARGCVFYGLGGLGPLEAAKDCG